MNNTAHYFNTVYPSRKLGKLFGFRRKSNERAKQIRPFLDHTELKSLCDIGCGDGLFLKELRRDLPSLDHIQVEDITKKNIDMALKNLKGYALSITSNINKYDEYAKGIDGDIVLCIGVSDYYVNWQKLITNLLNRTEYLLIVDFPIHGKFRNFLRKIWLSFFNVKFNDTTKSNLKKIFDRHSFNYSIIKTKYNWIVILIKKDFKNATK